MSETVIRDITPRLVTFSRPFYRAGVIPFGGRSTAIKLSTGKVWLLASTPPDEPTKAKLQSMGAVGYIVAPDAEHTISLKPWAEIYPTAKVIAVEGVEKKFPDLKVETYTREKPNPKFGFEDEIEAQYFPGFANKDVAFLHKADGGTLIEADLCFNLPAKEQFSKTSAGHPNTWWPGSTTNPNSFTHQLLLWATTQNREEMKYSAKQVADWKFERIIPCHGEVIETGGNAVWRHLYRKYLS